MEKNKTTNKPKEINVELSIEIIPDEDEIREEFKRINKIKKREKLWTIIASLSLLSLAISMLCLIFIKFNFFFICSAIVSAIVFGIADSTIRDCITTISPRWNKRFIANPPNGSLDAGCPD